MPPSTLNYQAFLQLATKGNQHLSLRYKAGGESVLASAHGFVGGRLIQLLSSFEWLRGIPSVKKYVENQELLQNRYLNAVEQKFGSLQKSEIQELLSKRSGKPLTGRFIQQADARLTENCQTPMVASAPANRTDGERRSCILSEAPADTIEVERSSDALVMEGAPSAQATQHARKALWRHKEEPKPVHSIDPEPSLSGDRQGAVSSPRSKRVELSYEDFLHVAAKGNQALRLRHAPGVELVVPTRSGGQVTRFLSRFGLFRDFHPVRKYVENQELLQQRYLNAVEQKFGPSFKTWMQGRLSELSGKPVTSRFIRKEDCVIKWLETEQAAKMAKWNYVDPDRKIGKPGLATWGGPEMVMKAFELGCAEAYAKRFDAASESHRLAIQVAQLKVQFDMIDDAENLDDAENPDDAETRKKQEETRKKRQEEQKAQAIEFNLTCQDPKRFKGDELQVFVAAGGLECFKREGEQYEQALRSFVSGGGLRGLWEQGWLRGFLDDGGAVALKQIQVKNLVERIAEACSWVGYPVEMCLSDIDANPPVSQADVGRAGLVAEAPADTIGVARSSDAIAVTGVASAGVKPPVRDHVSPRSALWRNEPMERLISEGWSRLKAHPDIAAKARAEHSTDLDLIAHSPVSSDRRREVSSVYSTRGGNPRLNRLAIQGREFAVIGERPRLEPSSERPQFREQKRAKNLLEAMIGEQSSVLVLVDGLSELGVSSFPPQEGKIFKFEGIEAQREAGSSRLISLEGLTFEQYRLRIENSPGKGVHSLPVLSVTNWNASQPAGTSRDLERFESLAQHILAADAEKAPSRADGKGLPMILGAAGKDRAAMLAAAIELSRTDSSASLEEIIREERSKLDPRFLSRDQDFRDYCVLAKLACRKEKALVAPPPLPPRRRDPSAPEPAPRRLVKPRMEISKPI